MRILFINPPENFERNYGYIADAADLVVPLNILFLSSYLTAKGHKPEILDAFIHRMDIDEIIKQTLVRKPDVVGITATTPIAPAMYKISKELKRVKPDLPIIFGGVHATAMPDDCFEGGKPDYVIRGEGEYILSNLLEFFSENKRQCNLPGVSYIHNGKVVHNEDDRRIVDINSIPIPDYSMVPMSQYKPKPHLIKKPPVHTVMGGRGCPFRCEYCSNNDQKNPYRGRDIDLLFEELHMLVNKYNAGQIRFIDDNFTLHRQRVIQICERMLSEELSKRIVWDCSSRVDAVDKEIMELMKKAGCVLIYYGIETGNQELLDSVQKKTTISQAETAIELMRKVGIESRASFMLGLPDETREMTERTIDFAIKLNPDYATFLLATPFPGTAFFDSVRNQISSFEWDKFITVSGFSDFDPVYVPNGREPKEMKKYQRDAFRRFYNRPSQYLHQLKSIRSLEDFKRRLNVGFKLMQSSLKG